MCTRRRHPAHYRRLHARWAARDRYGLDARAVRAVERLVRHGGPPGARVAIDTGHPRRDRSAFAIKYEGVWYPVVYDPATRALVSFLPPHVLDRPGVRRALAGEGRAG
jgi:hypothetical protein